MDYHIEDTNQVTYSWVEKKRRQFKKRAAEEIIYQVSFDDARHGELMVNMQSELRNMFNEVIRKVKGDNVKAQIGRIYVNHPDMAVPILVPPRLWNEINGDVIMDQIANRLESVELRLDEGLEIHVGSINVLGGNGRSTFKLLNLKGPNNDIKRKKSLISVVNK